MITKKVKKHSKVKACRRRHRTKQWTERKNEKSAGGKGREGKPYVPLNYGEVHVYLVII